MSYPVDPEALIIRLLDGLIIVLDDGSVQVLGTVSAEWYNKELFADRDWHVSVGPGYGVGKILDLGAFNKEYVESVPVNIWVLQKRGANYTPKRIMRDIISEVERLIFSAVHSPGGILKDADLKTWVPRDEPENRILRRETIVEVTWERART